MSPDISMGNGNFIAVGFTCQIGIQDKGGAAAAKRIYGQALIGRCSRACHTAVSHVDNCIICRQRAIDIETAAINVF